MSSFKHATNTNRIKELMSAELENFEQLEIPGVKSKVNSPFETDSNKTR
jgi:hypothetical protein